MKKEYAKTAKKGAAAWGESQAKRVAQPITPMKVPVFGHFKTKTK
jgi:hypothetical protein